MCPGRSDAAEGSAGLTVLDYHLHLWPHGRRDTAPTLEQVGEYCERAQAAGVTEIALTEHLFRFVQADRLLRGFWEDEPDAALRASMATYWEDHARADLDAYVECVLAAKDAGMPVVLGLEVDYYRGRMDDVSALLEGYPFDVLLGSVHWVGVWRFDDVSDPVSMAQWSVRDVDAAWDGYTSAMEELAATGACDVLAHPDLVKAAGHRPAAPEECWDRLVEAAVASGMAAELSSAGWRKPAREAYPAEPLLARFVARGVPLTTASDAHGLADVAHRVGDLGAMLGALGVDRLRAFRSRRAQDVPVETSVSGR
jgi:histidinol-phosphatase (PHP family)